MVRCCKPNKPDHYITIKVLIRFLCCYLIFHRIYTVFYLFQKVENYHIFYKLLKILKNLKKI